MRLGLTLRSVALRPRDGYAAAIRAGERRARAGERLPEGLAPYVLAAAGGAGLMTVWLKLGALVGLRAARATEFDGGVVVAALVLGVAISLAGQFLWGALGPRLAARLGGRSRARDLRLAWGASALPLVGVLALLPLDLVVVGPAALASDPLADPIATGWAAASIACGSALAAWSAWLFVRGVEVAADVRLARAVALAVAAGGCAAALVGGLALAGGLTGGPVGA